MASSFPRLRIHDVFINYRGYDSGYDTRDNFTGRLRSYLRQRDITNYIEYEIHVSTDEMYQRLYTGIEESAVSVVIFSENYASSKWCLDELVKIQECRKSNGQIVIPVFYKIYPTQVLQLTGTYANHLAEHEQELGERKVQKWKDALTETANLPGRVSSNYRLSEFLKEIADDIAEKLTHVTTYDSLRFVGIEKHIMQVEALLQIDSSDDSIAVGIWGTGGIGKTTIATGVYCKLRHKFDACYFLENVRENSEKRGLIALRNEILSQILDPIVEASAGSAPDLEKLRYMKVFLVLDDVSNITQLDYLMGASVFFNQGSRIIVTTRDRNVLDRKGVNDNHIYDAKGLDWNEALKLFSLRAFDQNCPPEAFTDLSERLVSHATGVPLVLNLLGSLLYGRSMEEWESAFGKIENGQLYYIYQVLVLSYDALNQNDKNLFLDVTCFFKGEELEFVKRISNACGFSADRGIPRLMEKSLVTISNNIIEVYASLQDMVEEIIGRNIQEPGERSRLWDPEHVDHIFRCNSGTEAVEGIFLDMSKVKEIELSPEAFTRMSKLRLLKFYVPAYHDSSKLCLPWGLDYLPRELRYLHWHGYPLKSLPSRFCPEKLVELHMPHSNVEELWEGIQSLPFLYYIDLSHSRNLIAIPDFSQAPSLQSINLEFCTSLLQVHPSIQYLVKLRHLNLQCCENLLSLPSHIKLTSLEVLDLQHCSNLQMFPVIEGDMENLVSLALGGCESLKCLPSSIHMLKALTILSLDDCSKLEELPEIFESMARLKSLCLRGTAIKKLPSSISHLVGLKTLSLDMCRNLKFLPEINNTLKWLETLSLSNCEKIENLPRLAGLSSLVELNLSGCCNLLQILEDIGSLSSLSNFSVKGSKIMSIPASIKNLHRLYRLDLTDCSRLEFLPELSPVLQYLYATNCVSLGKVSGSKVVLNSRNITEDTGNNHDNVQLFDFTGCLELDQESCSNIMVDAQIRIRHMAKLSRKLSPSLTICFPGNEIPDLFSHRAEGSCLTMKVSPGWCNDRFLGFALCVVTEFKGRALVDFRLQCGLKINDGNIRKYNSPCLWYGTRFVDSHHTLLWYDHVFHHQTMKEIKNGNRIDEISFDFYSINDHDFVYSWEVTKCGICLLYAHEELDTSSIIDDDDEEEEEEEDEDLG
ncbi:Disease resistance protein (TIR-NBS-LRR class) family [Quillaja saponaria]|uniref:ADP-ribosyl cyclase/cyclic ADP-ribose hydrolase n=1 Tax=Quillaja saponaria TaxID=32244 RepID=A0AAD7PE53_QUISA|nr:Disease resistance protein (TIR-NBS-LRR class) family [Quillaja saponaria]KAJ7951585.1 Disease resistance protein (TIR-NBS-LRR class) family [Quillaja saponaria]